MSEVYTLEIPGKLAEYCLTIPDRLPGLNEYIEETRRNKYKGAQMKSRDQALIEWCIYSQLRKIKISNPVFLLFTWYEKDRRRDHDNVSSYGRKIIQDALVETGVLLNDGWQHVTGYIDRFEVDSKNPRVIVQFIEQEEAQCKQKQKKN